MSPAPEHVGEVRRGHHRTDRQAAAERLRSGQHVRAHGQLLVGPHGAVRPIPHWTSSKIRIALASSQASRAATRTSLAIGNTPASPWIGSMITAAVRGPIAANRPSVVTADGDETGRQRPKRSSRASRGVAVRAPSVPAVKAAVEGDDLRPPDPDAVGALAGELDRALAGLGAGVAQEDGAAQARLGEALGQPQGRLGIEQVRRARELARLLADRLDDPRMAVARVVKLRARRRSPGTPCP